jgi:hypothetical protein
MKSLTLIHLEIYVDTFVQESISDIPVEVLDMIEIVFYGNPVNNVD